MAACCYTVRQSDRLYAPMNIIGNSCTSWHVRWQYLGTKARRKQGPFSPCETCMPYERSQLAGNPGRCVLARYSSGGCSYIRNAGSAIEGFNLAYDEFAWRPVSGRFARHRLNPLSRTCFAFFARIPIFGVAPERIARPSCCKVAA